MTSFPPIRLIVSPCLGFFISDHYSTTLIFQFHYHLFANLVHPISSLLLAQEQNLEKFKELY